MKKEVKQPIMPYDILLSGIEAKDAESVRISRIMKRSGVRVERGSRTRCNMFRFFAYVCIP